MDPKQLKKLTELWEKKLAASGLENIEDGDYLYKYAGYFKAKFTPDEFEEKADYYYYAFQKLESGRFENKKERVVWQMHCEALGSRETAKKLKALGYKKINKDKVLAIVKQLKQRFKEEVGD